VKKGFLTKRLHPSEPSEQEFGREIEREQHQVFSVHETKSR